MSGRPPEISGVQTGREPAAHAEWTDFSIGML
jgi:hypothetical protein